jgi:hypothetical protein
MGFFKKIGASIKKVTKQISLKNVLKVASSFDPTGLSGGVLASIQAKKDEKAALLEQEKAQAEYDSQVLANNQEEAKKYAELVEKAKAEAEYQRMVIATNNQAIGGKIGLVGGSIVGQIGNEALKTGIQQIDENVKKGLAQSGSELANLTITEWLKEHWWKLLVGVVAIGLILRFTIGAKKR